MKRYGVVLLACLLALCLAAGCTSPEIIPEANTTSATTTSQTTTQAAAEGTEPDTDGSSGNPSASVSRAPAQNNTTTKAAATTKATATTTAKKQDTITVSILVECNTAVAYGNSTAASISNGGVITQKSVTLKEGASVYDALTATGLTVKSSGGALGQYVSAISGLSERACGGQSGWLYFVNGTAGSVSCSKYVLKNGDSISWRYTCKSGNDL